MKSVFLIILLSITSCASRAPLSYKQSCGAKGMVLAGVNSQSGTFSGGSYNYQSNSYISSRDSYDGESVQCVVPQTKKQECEASVYGQAAQPVLEYNDGYGTKRFLTGLGYYALIAPGIGFKLYYDSQLDKAVAKSREIEKEAFYGCNQSEERYPASK